MKNKEENIPRHIAIIMDGNGRWAKERNLPRTQGHREGAKRVEEVVGLAQSLGVKVITLFTFSTENWNRPKSEVSLLMNLIVLAIKEKMEWLKKNNIRFQVIGRQENIPEPVWQAIKMTIEETKDNNGFVINLAFNYGARGEIVDAIKSICQSVETGQLSIDDISEKTVGECLYTKDLPDPDLLIRTSGEKRISNFLLWQLSYAELYFTEKYWPEFNAEEFKKALNEYQHRERRYGSVALNRN